MTHVPTALETSDTVIMAVTKTGTFFLDAKNGNMEFPELSVSIQEAGFALHPTAYATGTFYLVGRNADMDSVVTAIDSATGAPRWTIGLDDPNVGIFHQDYPEWVAADGNTVYVGGTIDPNSDSFDAPSTGFIRAFDAANGHELWLVKGTDIDNVLIPPSGHYLLAASGVVATNSGQVQMLDADKHGIRGWKIPVAHPDFLLGSSWPMTCYANGMFLFEGGNGDTLFAVDAATGIEKWHHHFDSINSELVKFGSLFAGLDGATVYVPIGSDLVAMDSNNGALKWVATLTDSTESGMGNLFSATLQTSTRAGLCSADTVFVTDTAKTLWAIDAATGKARWRYSDPAQPDLGFLWTVGGDRVIIASNLTVTAIAVHGQ